MTRSRTGRDETAIVILEQLPFDDNIFVSYLEIVDTMNLKDVIDRVVYLDKFYNFKKIILDETGLGAGVSDMLKSILGGKVEGIWYTQKLKIEMFNNLKLLMMRKEGRLFIPDYITMNKVIIKKMYYQFLSITQKFNEKTNSSLPKISHEQRSHDDIINAIALAAMYWKIGKKRNRKFPFGGFN